MILYIDNGLREPNRVDPEETMIAIILTEQDKANIAQMPPGYFVYCSYPEEVEPKYAQQFIKDCKRMEDKQ